MKKAPVLLLVGGTGFVGRHLARALKRQFSDYDCVILDKKNGLFIEGWRIVVGDLLDAVSIEHVIATLRPKVTIHLAAQASIDTAANAAEMTWRVNFGGTLELASAIARHAPDGIFFFTSSAEVYGLSFASGPANEDTALMPGNAYAASKMAAEYALMQVLPPQTRLIVARAFNHTGPGQDERFALPSFAAQIARIEQGLKKPVIDVGDLSFQRDFLHVSDVVDAYLRLLTNASLDHRVLVNVCSGQGHRIRDLLNQLCRMAKVPVEIVLDPSRVRSSGISATIGDPSRLKALTGWKPTQDMDELLSELLEWWRSKISLEKETPNI